MEPISAVDRLVLMLRQRLQARERVRGGKPRGVTPATVGGLQALEAAQLEDGPLQRAVIQSLLVDHFGQGLMNDARFQQMVSRVTEAIASDPAGRTLMDEVTRELRAEAR